VRYWASSRPWWFLVLLAPLALAMTFTFYLVTPRLVLDLDFGLARPPSWRGHLYRRGRSAQHGIDVRLASWFGWYGKAYGGFGVALALMSWMGILALFWVWIAAAQGVYWERRASPGTVLAMEQESEDRDNERRVENHDEPVEC
jgi:hypothetical protein